MFKKLTAVCLFLSAAHLHAQDLSKLTLPEVYSIPVNELERIVFEKHQSICEGLVSGVTQGVNDPAKLSPAEFCAVQHYSNGGYSVNEKLSSEDPTKMDGNDWAYVRVLDAALAKIKCESGKVYRGTSQRIKFTKGKPVRLKGYTSTSVTPEAAEAFISNRLMVIDVKCGKNLKPYSNAGLEEEWLMPRSTYFEYVDSKTGTMRLFDEAAGGPVNRRVEKLELKEVPKKPVR